MISNNYPKAWLRFTSQTHEPDHVIPEALIDNFAQLARWSARFRLAKSFKALDVGEHYSGSDTPQLYSAITRIFLVYSAFETYCRIIGLNPSRETEVKLLENGQSQQAIIKTIRDLDPKNSFPTFLLKHLNRNLQEAMQLFINGEDVNISFLARCTRHVFAHGILTANSPGISAKKFDQISQVISTFLLDCMDEDFDKRVP